MASLQELIRNLRSTPSIVRDGPTAAVANASLTAAQRPDEIASMTESWVELGMPMSRASLSSSVSHSPFPEQIKEKLGTDWMWDWPSRPEAIPPAHYTPKTKGSTPPNSPLPSPCVEVWSWRNTALVKTDVLSMEMVFGLIVSNMITFVIGACVGVCVARRLREETALD